MPNDLYKTPRVTKRSFLEAQKPAVCSKVKSKVTQGYFQTGNIVFLPEE